MRFGLIANLKRAGAMEAIEFFMRWADKSKNELFFSDDLKNEKFNGVNFLPRNEIGSKVDIMVSMGGDGTILASARAIGRSNTPILGVNLGSLGFLTQLSPQQMLPALDSIIKKEYEIEDRMLLKAEASGIESAESPFALNDIVINKGGVSRMIELSLCVNGEDIVTYRADGLIIATPTGSTAYSLSAGGPIMHPKMQAMIATPISAFSLTTRPMIFSSNDKLEVKILMPDQSAKLTIDGQIMLPVENGTSVTISKADFYSKFIVFPDNTFYEILKSKLHWGFSPYS